MRIVIKSALCGDLVDRLRGDLEQIHRAADLEIVDILKWRQPLRLSEDIDNVVFTVVEICGVFDNSVGVRQYTEEISLSEKNEELFNKIIFFDDECR